MIKKIFIGALFVGLIAVLVFGALHRTIAKAGNEPHSTESRAFLGNEQDHDNQGRSESPDKAGSASSGYRGGGSGGNGGYDGGQEDRGGQGKSAGQGSGGSQGRGQGQGQFGVNGSGNAQVEIVDPVNLQASVVSVNGDLLTFALQDGESIEVEGRTLRFMTEQGFMVQPGNQILLAGFYDTNGTFEISVIENLTTGASLVIRNEDGRPMWAGQRNN
jgi:hypothetical protein